MSDMLRDWWTANRLEVYAVAPMLALVGAVWLALKVVERRKR